MLAVVRKHHTGKALFEIKGDIPQKVMSFLRKEFGPDVKVMDEEEEFVNILDTGWFKEIGESTTPGEVMKIYRENAGFTQSELGKKLGKFSRQKISDMERGNRNISLEVARKLSKLFNVSVDRFL